MYAHDHFILLLQRQLFFKKLLPTTNTINQSINPSVLIFMVV